MLVLFSCPFLALAVPDATISPGEYKFWTRPCVKIPLSDNVFLPEKRGDASSFQQLIVDQKSTSVYVGGRGVVYRLWLYNINDTGSANLVLLPRVAPTNLYSQNLFSLLKENGRCMQKTVMNASAMGTRLTIAMPGFD